MTIDNMPPPVNPSPDASQPPDASQRVELTLLLAIERCAQAVEAGIAAENHQFAVSYGQAAAALAQAYQAIAADPPQSQQMQMGTGG